MDSTIETRTASGSSNLLRNALRGNALFSEISGLFLVVGAGPAATFLGWEQPLVLRIIGLALVLYGVELFYVASREELNRTLAWLAVALDIAWVAGSALVLFGGLVPLTTGGKWAVAIIADIVAAFAFVQYLGIRRLDDSE